MTVKQLIEKLKKYDENLEVKMETKDWQLLYSIQNVYENSQDNIIISFYG